MDTSTVKGALFLSIFVAAAHASASLVAPIVDLGALPDVKYSDAEAINNDGVAAGAASIGNHAQQAALFHAHTITELGVLPGRQYSIALDVNSNGDAVGASLSHAQDVPEHGFLFAHGRLKDIGTLPGDTASEATALNSHDEVVGYSYGSAGIIRAFVYRNGAAEALNMPVGADGSMVGDINSAGVIVGSYHLISSGSRAFKYVDGKMVDIGISPTHTGSEADAINEAGHITGTDGDGIHDQAFLYDGKKIIDLGVPKGMQRSFGLDINSFDEVVGFGDQNNPPERAALFKDGKAIDLNELLPPDSGWTLERATGINDLHQIVGFGELHGSTHAFLMTLSPATAIPLPTAFWSGSAAMAIPAFVGLARRRHRLRSR